MKIQKDMFTYLSTDKRISIYSTAISREYTSDTSKSAWENFRRPILAFTLGTVLTGALMSNAHAVVMGRVTTQSALGEPLRAEIDVSGINKADYATLQAAIASQDAFQTAGLEYNPALSGAKVSLVKKPNGRATLKIVGDLPVTDPFINLVIESSWASGRVVRSFTLLIDPPKNAQNNLALAPIVAPSVAPTTGAIVPIAPIAQTQTGGTITPVTPIAPIAPSIKESGSRKTSPKASGDQNLFNLKPEGGRGRAASKTTSVDTANSDNRVTVERGNTAGGIAREHMGSGVSLDQMLAAILRNNPHAFIKGNVNRLRSNVELSIPSAEEAQAISKRKAHQIVQASTHNFGNYRRTFAKHAPRASQNNAANAQSMAGQIQTVPSANVAAGNTQTDKLTLTKPNAAGNNLEKMAQSRQSKENNTRLTEAEKINQNLQNAANTASQMGVTPNKSTPAGNAPAISTTTPAVSSSQAPVSQPTANNSATPQMPLAPVPVANAPLTSADPMQPGVQTPGVATTTQPSNPEATSTQNPTEPVKKPKPKRRVTAPVVEEEPSILDTIMENIVPIGGAILALLAGFLGWRFWSSRKKKGNDEFFDDSNDDSGFFEGNEPDDLSVLMNNRKTINTPEAAKDAESQFIMNLDPLLEAQTYIEHNRDQEAEKILKAALPTSKNPLSIHKKLLEIYAKRRDARAYAALATLTSEMVSLDSEDWIEICTVGQNLDPNNALYHLPGMSPAFSQANTQNAPPAAPTPPSQGNFAGLASAPAIQKSAPEPVDLMHNQLSAFPTRTMAQLRPEQAKAPAPVDLDLDLDFSSGFQEMHEEQAAEREMQAKAQQASPAVPSAAPVAQAQVPNNVIDFDLGDLSFDTPPLATKTAPTTSNNTPPVLNSNNLVDFSDDLQLSSQQPGFTISTQSIPSGDTNPWATKLALAQEFKAIGDIEGASMLLKEIASSDSGNFKTQAQNLLKDLNS